MVMLCSRKDFATNDTVVADASIPFDIVISTVTSSSSIQEIDTSLHNINPNILHNSLNLLLYKRRRSLMNRKNTLRVLRSQSRGSSHSIAAMRRNDLLIGFEAPARWPSARCVLQSSKRKSSPLPHTRSNSRPTRAVRASYQQNALHRCLGFVVIVIAMAIFESPRCSAIELLWI